MEKFLSLAKSHCHHRCLRACTVVLCQRSHAYHSPPPSANSVWIGWIRRLSSTFHSNHFIFIFCAAHELILRRCRCTVHTPTMAHEMRDVCSESTSSFSTINGTFHFLRFIRIYFFCSVFHFTIWNEMVILWNTLIWIFPSFAYACVGDVYKRYAQFAHTRANKAII